MHGAVGVKVLADPLAEVLMGAVTAGYREGTGSKLLAELYGLREQVGNFKTR
jgi:hypothetical protein